MNPAFPSSKRWDSHPRQTFNSSRLAFSPPGTPWFSVISELDLGTQQHRTEPRGCGCPRFHNLEVLLPAAAQTQSTQGAAVRGQQQHQPSYGSCQVGQAPGRSGSSSLDEGCSQMMQGAWLGEGCWFPCSAAAGCTLRRSEGLCSPHCCTPRAHRAAASTNPSPCRKTQCAQGL